MHAMRLAVRQVEDAFTSSAKQVAVIVEYSNRMVAAIEGIDVVLAIDSDRGPIPEYDLFRNFRPILLDLECPLAAANRNGQAFYPIWIVRSKAPQSSNADAFRCFPLSVMVVSPLRYQHHETRSHLHCCPRSRQTCCLL